MGHAGVRDHPLLAGLFNQMPGAASTMASVGYSAGWPERSRVIAVACAGGQLFPEHATIWETDAPTGSLALAIGAPLPFSNTTSPPVTWLDRLLHNALDYCARRQPARRGYWPRPGETGASHRDSSLAPLLLPTLTGTWPESPRILTSMETSVDASLLLAGSRVCATGSTRHGVRAVWVHPTRIMQDITLPGCPAVDCRFAADAAQRTGECLDEFVMIALDQPGIIWQWHANQAFDFCLDWLVDLRLSGQYPAGLLGPLRWNEGDRWLLVVGADERDAALYCFNRGVTWQVEPAPDTLSGLRVSARVHLQAGDLLTLAALGASPDRESLNATARALDRPTHLWRNRSARSARLEQDRLSIHCPDVALHEACRRAVQQLHAALTDVPGVGRSLAEPSERDPNNPVTLVTSASVQLALACLAVGDFPAARAVLEFLGATQDPQGRVPSSFTTSGCAEYAHPADTLLYLLLSARYFAWSGDLAFLRSNWNRVQQAVHGGDPNAVGRNTVFRELADVAREIGAAGIHVTTNASSSDDWSFLRPWTSWSESGLPARATSLPSAARPIASLVFGMLGVEPDAARGRLRLRPVLPRDWPELSLERLRMGEAHIDFRYQQNQDELQFSFNQVAGTVPMRVIFEPLIAASRIAGITVDGRPAALHLERQGERWSCPLQVVLDHERRICFSIEP
jgi:hypothetical protein